MIGRGGWLAGGLAAVACLASSGASAQGMCRVADPTGTLLNVRAEPGGRIIGQLENGTPVIRDGDALDERGRPWTYLRSPQTGTGLGWAVRAFVRC